MRTRRLGNTDMDFTVVGFGAWAVGGEWQFGWGPQDDADSVAAIQRAIDLGVNWIDTAHVYGFGRSEEVVGRAIRGRRDRVFVATKCGLVHKGGGEAMPRLKADSVREEIEGSLRRLGVDAIDLYQIHWPNPPEDIEEAWTEIQRAKDAGKIRWAGVSNHDPAQMRRLQAIAPVSSLQPPYSMLNRASEEEILPFCKDQGIGVVCYSPMECGLLTGKASKEWLATLDETDVRRRHHRSFKEPAFSASVEFVDTVLAPIAEAHGVQPAQIAVAWVLRHPAVTSAIVGARNPGQIEKTVRAAEVELSDADLEAIEDGLAARARKAG